MDENLKMAAERLLKIADDIESEAFENTYFVCDTCNHTANLSTINGRRSKAASENGIETVSLVTVNGTVGCPACEGDMKYVATEDSSKYYVEAAEDMDPIPDEPDPAGEAPKDDESAFEPVDEQEDKKKKKKEEGGEPSEIDLGFGEEDVEVEGPTDEVDDEDAPKPEGAGDGEKPTGDPDITLEPTEEELGDAEPKKKPKKKKDKPDDGKAAVPKEDTPKFEDMPKEASESYYWSAVARYSVD